MGRIPERICLAIYDAVKAGRQAELDAAGVTKFTITAGQTLNTTIDAVQTAAAAKAAAGL